MAQPILNATLKSKNQLEPIRFSWFFRLFQDFGEGCHFFFAEGQPFAHLFVFRTPFADVVFWRSAVPADQVQFFRPTFCGCGQDAEFFDDFKCDVCHREDRFYFGV